MANKNMSKEVLGVVKKKTGKNVSEKDIYKLASGVKRLRCKAMPS